MAALASDWLKHFSTSPQLLNGFSGQLTGSMSSTSSANLCFSCRSEIQDGRPGLWLAKTFIDFLRNRWMDFDETWQEASPQCPLRLYQVCVFHADRKSKMAALASDWLKHFTTTSLQWLNGFWWNLTGSKSSTPSIMFVFSFRSKIQDGRPGLWLTETFFDIFCATAEWILTKPDRKPDALYQVCAFRADRKSKMASLTSYWLCQPLNGYSWNLTGNPAPDMQVLGIITLSVLSLLQYSGALVRNSGPFGPLVSFKIRIVIRI